MVPANSRRSGEGRQSPHGDDPLAQTPVDARGPAFQRTIDERDLPTLTLRRRDNPWLRRGLILVTCVLLADALFGDRGLAQTIRAGRQYQQAIAELRQMRAENAGLREQQRRLREDPRTIEAVAREELGLIRPGEILFIVK
jgi:cell division protein FtsB